MAENFKWNNDEHTYEIVAESLVDVAKKNIDMIAEKKDMVITNDADFKVIKEMRRLLNKEVKTVADARKQMTAIVLSKFVPQCKEIERYGALIATELTQKMDEYKGVVKDEMFKLTITSNDKKAIEKVKQFALSYNCEVKDPTEKPMEE